MNVLMKARSFELSGSTRKVALATQGLWHSSCTRSYKQQQHCQQILFDKIETDRKQNFTAKAALVGNVHSVRAFYFRPGLANCVHFYMHGF